MTDPRPFQHGTESGAKIHRRHGEKPCGPCADAERESSRARYRAKRPPGADRAVLDSVKKPRPTAPLTWGDRAACKGTDLDRWVPDTVEVVTKWHEAWCRVCPVYDECLTWALAADEHGLWAATTRAQRRALRPRKGAA